MAEIRKHNPQIRDEIDRAIHAALGEDVRPVQQQEWRPKDGPREETFTTPETSAPAPAVVSSFATFAPGLGAAGWTTLDPSKVAKPLGVRPTPVEDDDEED